MKLFNTPYVAEILFKDGKTLTIPHYSKSIGGMLMIFDTDGKSPGDSVIVNMLEVISMDVLAVAPSQGNA